MEQRLGAYFLIYFALFNAFLAGIDTTAIRPRDASLWQVPACAWYAYLATAIALLLTVVVVVDFFRSSRRGASATVDGPEVPAPLVSQTVGE
jgi:hypothetical protein